MIYFITKSIDEEPKIIEKSLRGCAVEKFYSLDILKSTVLVESDERYFIGLEKTNTIKFLRIRSVLEYLFPKLILKFDKDNFRSYKVRFALLPFIILLFTSIGSIAALIAIVNNINDIDMIIIPLIISICFLLFTKIELKLIDKKIKKSIEKTIANTSYN